MTSKERRQHKRVKVDKAVKLRNGSGEYDVRLTDISTSGASLNVENIGDILEEDQDVEIEMEDFGVLAGSVVRTLEDGFAVEFEHDEESEERLINEITGYQTGLEYD